MTHRNLVAAVTMGALLLGGGALLPARGLQPSVATAGSDPTDAASLAELGMANLDEVRANADPRFYPKAEEAFRKALELDPRNFEATFGMATLAAGRHDFVAGLEWSRKAIELNPYSSDPRGIQGDSLIELGRYRAAARALQRMVDLKPGLPAFARISYLRELRGDIPGALRAMKLAFDHAGAAGDAAFAAAHLGDLHLLRQRITAAEAWYLRGNEMDPSASQPVAGLAKIAALRGDLDGAIEAILELLDRNEEPGNAFFLGDLYTASGDAAAAADAYSLGQRLNDRETANGSDVKLEGSLFAADHGRPRQALRLARAEYRIRQSIHVSDAYAWALYANGKYQKAQQLSEDSLRLGTESALFHFHAGMIAVHLDQRAKAVSHLTAALDLNPVFSLEHRATAQRVLDQLEGRCGEAHR